MIQLTTEQRDQIFDSLKNNFNNDRCIDCGKSTKWASVYLGLFLCIDCAGKHREYGVKYSFVRSLTLDGWNQKQILFMQLGGNQKFKEYWQNEGTTNIIDYKSQQSLKYKDDLHTKVEEELNKVNPQLTQINLHSSQHGFEQPSKFVQEAVKDEPHIEDVKNTLIGANVEVVSKQKPQNQQSNKKQAKKIDIDFESLQFDDPFGLNKPQEKVQVISNITPVKTEKAEITTFKQAQPQINKADLMSAQEKLDQMKHKPVKAISSQSFEKQEEQHSSTKIQAFQGQQAISSKEYFGEPEEKQDSGDKMEKVRNFLWSAKDTAGGYINNLKNKFQQPK